MGGSALCAGTPGTIDGESSNRTLLRPAGQGVAFPATPPPSTMTASHERCVSQRAEETKKKKKKTHAREHTRFPIYLRACE